MNNILMEYDERRDSYIQFEKKIRLLIDDIIENKMNCTISSRVKDRISLKKKLDKKNNKYSDINQITDIIGIRIITLFSADLDIIAKLIETEFSVDKINSVDKRKVLEPDRFGYLSLHYVVSLNDQRLDLLEYKKFKNIRFEIQIRSILQHAWAEIEHELGYKSSIEIPLKERRDFSRLASLLEIADEKFGELKKNLEIYKVEIGDTDILNEDFSDINLVTLSKYIDESDMTNKFFKVIEEKTNTKRSDSENLYSELAILEYLNITNFRTIENLIEENFDEMVKLFTGFVDLSKWSSFGKNLVIFYLGTAIVLKERSVEALRKYYESIEMFLQGNIENIYDKLVNILDQE